MLEAINAIADYAQRNPGIAMMAFGALVLSAKLYKTASKRTSYSILQFWRYPDDALVTGMSLMLFLTGFSIVVKRFWS